MFYNAYRPRYIVLPPCSSPGLMPQAPKVGLSYALHVVSSEGGSSIYSRDDLPVRKRLQTDIVTYHPTPNRLPFSIGTCRLQIHLQSTTFLNR